MAEAASSCTWEQQAEEVWLEEIWRAFNSKISYFVQKVQKDPWGFEHFCRPSPLILFFPSRLVSEALDAWYVSIVLNISVAVCLAHADLPDMWRCALVGNALSAYISQLAGRSGCPSSPLLFFSLILSFLVSLEINPTKGSERKLNYC